MKTPEQSLVVVYTIPSFSVVYFEKTTKRTHAYRTRVCTLSQLEGKFKVPLINHGF